MDPISDGEVRVISKHVWRQRFQNGRNVWFSASQCFLYLEEIFERRDEIIFYSPAHGDRPHWHALEHCELVFDYTIQRKNAFVSDNSHERF